MAETAEYVTDSDGVRAAFEPGARPWDVSSESVTVRLADGSRLALPADLLVLEGAGRYRLSHRFADLMAAGRAGADGGEVVIPVVEERLHVGRRQVETGGVRVTKRVETRREVADVPLSREEVTVERVAINRRVDASPEPRQEGDTLIVPLLEEILVVEKRLMLREELHIRRTHTETRDPQTVTLRREVAEIERVGTAPEGMSPAAEPKV